MVFVLLLERGRDLEIFRRSSPLGLIRLLFVFLFIHRQPNQVSFTELQYIVYLLYFLCSMLFLFKMNYLWDVRSAVHPNTAASVEFSQPLYDVITHFSYTYTGRPWQLIRVRCPSIDQLKFTYFNRLTHKRGHCTRFIPVHVYTLLYIHIDYK